MSTFQSSREMAAGPEKVFAAFADPVRMARWWGPAGFSNTFEICEFKSGGKWKYMMHGPDGKNYPNESVFVEVVPSRKIVVEHIVNPKYRLTIDLSPSAKGTLITWTQVFESAKVAEGLKHIIAPGNEQNLDKLTAEIGA